MMKNQKAMINSSIGKKQEINIGFDVENGVIRKIYNTYIYQPEVCFKGGTIEWYKDYAVNHRGK